MIRVNIRHAGGVTAFTPTRITLKSVLSRPTELVAEIPVTGETALFGSDPLIREGSEVTLTEDGETRFRGYLFTFLFTGTAVRLSCFDLLYYLDYKDTRVFRRKKLSEIVREAAGEQLLPTGEIADSIHPLPTIICDGGSMLTLLSDAIDSTYAATGKRFFLRGKDGVLCLLDGSRAESVAAIGGQNILSFALLRDLSGCAAKVVLLRRDDRRGYESVTVREDKALSQSWGPLCYFERVSSSLGDGEVEALADSIFAQKTEAQVALTGTARADLRCLAGEAVDVTVAHAGISGKFLIESAQITLDARKETMTLRLVPAGK